jgi:hypothetical protein
MIEQKSYNFKILFDKIEEAERGREYYEAIDLKLLQEVDNDIKALEEYTNFLKEPQYQTYTRS